MQRTDDDRTVHCFYHSADLDGKCSAAIVLRAHPDVILHPINYSDPFPWGMIDADDLVYMVDFALQPWSDMEKLAGRCELIWIDHHKSALQAYKESDDWMSLPGLRRDGDGACQLCWEYLFPDDDLPLPVWLISRWDVWDHDEHSDVVPFQYGMQGVSNEPDDRVWLDLFDDEGISYPATFTTVQRGKTIYRYETIQNIGRVKALRFDVELDGVRCMAANVGLTSSLFFDSVWPDPRADGPVAMLTFHWRKGTWNVSLYSDRDDVDCAAVAAKHGGGGHKGAAGFQCDQLPFDLPRRGKA